MVSGYNSDRTGPRRAKILAHEATKSHVHDNKLITPKAITSIILDKSLPKPLPPEVALTPIPNKIAAFRRPNKEHNEHESLKIKLQTNANLITVQMNPQMN